MPFQFATPEPKRKEPPKWQRLKKPLKELLNKTLVELRRRDEVCEESHTNEYTTLTASMTCLEDRSTRRTFQATSILSEVRKT